MEGFQRELVRIGLIDQQLRGNSDNLPGSSVDLEDIARRFSAACEGHAEECETALLLARDYLGTLLAVTWGDLSPDFLTHHDVLRGLVRADRRITGGADQPIIRDCLAWREIAPVPDPLLLRPHSLADCGLRTQQATDSPTRVLLVDPSPPLAPRTDPGASPRRPGRRAPTAAAAVTPG